MDKRNKTALAYLLVGVAAAGRALLAVPENAAIQEVSLTVLALVGYLLLASKTRLPTVFGAAGLVLELILCGHYDPRLQRRAHKKIRRFCANPFRDKVTNTANCVILNTIIKIQPEGRLLL